MAISAMALGPSDSSANGAPPFQPVSKLQERADTARSGALPCALFDDALMGLIRPAKVW